ncbi:hypothetical protein BH23VER1_BH23VER1_26710 [soil metagenome]
MKKTVLTLLCVSVATAVIADIQSPPADRNGPIRKLSRAVANLVYGTAEIPSMWTHVRETEGFAAAGTFGIGAGAQKSVIRVGYGLYELFTFPAPTYKQGYKAPYYKKGDIHPAYGYSEFPPQLGFIGEADYGRTQSY